jgi:hypothetical protein
MIGDHGVIERTPLMEGRSLFIVMTPPTVKAERKDDQVTDGETIGEALAAKGQVPDVPEVAEAPISAPEASVTDDIPPASPA